MTSNGRRQIIGGREPEGAGETCKRIEQHTSTRLASRAHALSSSRVKSSERLRRRLQQDMRLQDLLTLSLQRVIDLKFPLQPQYQYNITQYGEISFLSLTQTKDAHTTNSHYLTYTFFLKRWDNGFISTRTTLLTEVSVQAQRVYDPLLKILIRQ